MNKNCQNVVIILVEGEKDRVKNLLKFSFIKIKMII